MTWQWWWNLGRKLGCHQLPERSFFWRGRQFPVCARCTGVYIGEIAGLAGHFLIGSFWRLDVVFCLVMLLDWAVQFMKIRTSTNLRRLVSGLLCGYGMMDLELLLAESVISQAALFLARFCDMGG